jgi:hypothetical protein
MYYLTNYEDDTIRISSNLAYHMANAIAAVNKVSWWDIQDALWAGYSFDCWGSVLSFCEYPHAMC